ncbi:WD repeat-containing protein 44 [Morus notabilis]|uniref:WD repeat-containing protein 44 n=1 Tax=Morus notabilis TaxID=981085 RepID=W9RDN6_9ROSA|nr:WD repeat-containing protein 44 [Morus notabilis]EXB83870.1 WD repeat-containing protein 44 [Morus notabilis]
MKGMSEEVDRFFDTREDISSVSDSSSDCPEDADGGYEVIDSLPGSSGGYDVWISDQMSIHERRDKFLRWMGLSERKMTIQHPGITSCDGFEVETDRITKSSDAVLGSSSTDNVPSSSQFSMSCSSNDARELVDGTREESFSFRIRNLDDGTEFVVDELGQDGMPRRLRKVGSSRLLTVEEFDRSLGMSPLVQRLMQKGVEEAFISDVARTQAKRRWLKRIGAAACIVDRQLEVGSINCYGAYPYVAPGAQAVKVRSYRKRSKELSALYMLQNIPAHEGSILTMKFSPDGQYLASAGEDGVVRIWQVMESDRSAEFDILDTDPSYAYFKINKFSEVVPCNVDTEKKGKLKATGKTCVIFPQKVFRILEKPIHEFRGHCGEVLDLSWSKNEHLLSSSVDKTVRLWRVGCDRCLNVFSHTSYVTSIQFNPVNDDYFISGSIDGKVRIWEIPACQVVDWTDVTEIVTAVCHHPDGKGGIVGSMNGDCHFFDLSDNRLQLYAQISLQGKKKSPHKRITGFQFSPSDPRKLMVTSADSQIRIIHGVDVIGKYRGFRNAGSQISATFTNDGAHIVSASEDSNVYIWNHRSEEGPTAQPKNHWACEHFFSNSSSVAIPWSSRTCRSYFLPSTSGEFTSSDLSVASLRGSKQSRFSSANHLSLSNGIFSESASKGSATWPEEKLPCSNSLAVSSAKCKLQHKFLKSFCQSRVGCPQTWGLVIVTAGWDGRIRSYQNYGLPLGL